VEVALGGTRFTPDWNIQDGSGDYLEPTEHEDHVGFISLDEFDARGGVDIFYVVNR
jgi:hypothetical protein